MDVVRIVGSCIYCAGYQVKIELVNWVRVLRGVENVRSVCGLSKYLMSIILWFPENWQMKISDDRV